MCLGPECSLLVCDGKTKNLLQLERAADETFLRLAAQKMLLGCHAVHGMTCVQQSDLLVMTLKFSKKIVAIKLSTGAVAWQRDGSIDHIPLNPEEVCTTSDGWICVANGNNVLALDASDGAHLTTLLEDDTITNIHKVAWSEEGDSPTLTIIHGSRADQITCFNVAFFGTSCPLRSPEIAS